MMKRGQTLIGITVLVGMLGWAAGDNVRAVQAAPLLADRVTRLPQSDTAHGPRVESTLKDTNLGYTVVLQQFKRPLVPPAVQRTLPTNDTVLQFAITWRHDARRLSGLLHAFRHETQLHLAVHQKVFLTDRTGYSATPHHQMTRLDLEGTIHGMHTDAKGFLVGTRVTLEFQFENATDIFGNRTILTGPLSIRRIGL